MINGGKLVSDPMGNVWHPYTGKFEKSIIKIMVIMLFIMLENHNG